MDLEPTLQNALDVAMAESIELKTIEHDDEVLKQFIVIVSVPLASASAVDAAIDHLLERVVDNAGTYLGRSRIQFTPIKENWKNLGD